MPLFSEYLAFKDAKLFVNNFKAFVAFLIYKLLITSFVGNPS